MKTQICQHDGPAVEIRVTRHKGRGVFAIEPLMAGQRLLRLEGQEFKAEDMPADALALQIDDDLWLCSEGAFVDDCINHSCEPNVGFLKNDPVLYALRDISRGEELSWDYSTSISLPGWSLVCLCESPRCRGLILPFGELTPPERRRLAPIALRYLRKGP